MVGRRDALTVVHGSSHVSPARMIILSQLNTVGNKQIHIHSNARSSTSGASNTSSARSSAVTPGSARKYDGQCAWDDVTAPIPTHECHE
jgi:hypothetical protein